MMMGSYFKASRARLCPQSHGRIEGNTDWQRPLVKELLLSGQKACWLGNRKSLERQILQRSYCDASWDGFSCWPQTPVNRTIEKPCSEVFANISRFNVKDMNGSAFKHCSPNSTWSKNGCTDYSICIKQLLSTLEKENQRTWLLSFQPFILLVGTLLSILCISSVIVIYKRFKPVDSVRAKIMLHMLRALLGRSITWALMTGPSVFPALDFNSVTWLCNTVVCLHLYTLLATAFSTLGLAHCLYQKLVMKPSLLDTPSRTYYALFAFGGPLAITSAWAALKISFAETGCWSTYMESRLFWIFSVPLAGASVANGIYLVKTVIIFVRGTRPFHNPTRQRRIRSAKGDIVILFLILALTQLIFPYYPDGDLGKHFKLFHAVLQSVQGILVSLLLCCLSSEQPAGTVDIELITISLQHSYGTPPSTPF